MSKQPEDILTDAGRSAPRDESRANARLIAAAPDLLKACETVVERLSAVLGPVYSADTPATRAMDACHATARAAVRKARGEG